MAGRRGLFRKILEDLNVRSVLDALVYHYPFCWASDTLCACQIKGCRLPREMGITMVLKWLPPLPPTPNTMLR